MLRKAKPAIIVFVLLWVSSTALAQDYDPFGSRDDDEILDKQDGRNNIQDEAKTFSGPMERLLDLAGEKKAVASDTKGWSNFERSDPQVVERYDTLFEWRMREESKKPLPDRPAYKGDIVTLQKDLEAIRPDNKRDDDFLFRHLYRADPVDSKAAHSGQFR